MENLKIAGENLQWKIWKFQAKIINGKYENFKRKFPMKNLKISGENFQWKICKFQAKISNGKFEI